MGIEWLWRGYSHWSMGVLGGICFIHCRKHAHLTAPSTRPSYRRLPDDYTARAHHRPHSECMASMGDLGLQPPSLQSIRANLFTICLSLAAFIIGRHPALSRAALPAFPPGKTKIPHHLKIGVFNRLADQRLLLHTKSLLELFFRHNGNTQLYRFLIFCRSNSILTH